MARRTWVQDPDTGKLIPKEEYRRGADYAHYIQGDIDSFVSPIDGSVISDRSHLRAHNARYGVTDKRDYSEQFIQERSKRRVAEATGQTPEARRERLDLIKRELYKAGL
jgi:hypothetical protein